ncbi:hypothetical protein VNI00_017977 [Paramarasmius palmivorus]|uniref:Oligopeptide transporter n=1 Tax=Paramarasmius palmivorus TaxID=297713 RepID=A0AAW0B383_9AGAR
MPILSSNSYNNEFKKYDVARILNQAEMKFDSKAYEGYSPLYLSTTFALSYGLSFATITATLSHAFIYYRRQIWNQARRSLQEQPDVHARLMSRYPQVPDWWYYTIFVIFFGFGVISIELWPTQMPVWALLLALVIAFVYVIPVGIVQAITNQEIALNVITELIIGYVLPGRPITMMMFKTWGYIVRRSGLSVQTNANTTIVDGPSHDIHIRPEVGSLHEDPSAAYVLGTGTVIAGTTQLGVQVWMFNHIPSVYRSRSTATEIPFLNSMMCDENQPNGFTCPHTGVFGVSSVIWGMRLCVIGPRRMFSKGSTYYPLVYFFLIGAIAPWIPWLINKRYPNSFMKYVHPVLFAGTNLLPPATALNFVPWAITGFIFQYYIRRRHFSWWTKYNYVLSAALDSGTAVAVILIYFALQYPQNGHIGKDTIQKWWGNTVHLSGADARETPLKRLADGETFGASTW